MKDLTEGKESKQIFNFAVPMLLGNVFQQLYNIVDSIIVGNFLGKEALSAVGASFPIIFVLISLIIGIASGSTIIIAQYFGAKDFKGVKQAMDTMYIVLFFASILITVLGISFSEQIFRLLELPENIIPKAKIYMNTFIGGIVVMFGYSGTSAVLRGLGDSKTPLYFLIVASLLNIGLDLLFVLVFGWGIFGVAIATVMAHGTAFAAAVFYLNRYHSFIRISLAGMNFQAAMFKKSLRIGLPSGLQQMFVALGMAALFRIVNTFGTNTIAAYSVATRIDSFALLPAMNFSAALTTFVGQNLGAKKPERVKRGMRFTFFVTSAISLFFSIVALTQGRRLMSFFTPEMAVIETGAEYLVIVGAFYIIFSTMFTINAVFRGAGDTLIPMFITLMALWLVRVPVSYWLSQSMDEPGIWWGIPIAWAFGAMVSFFYYLSGKWKNKVVVT